MLEVLLSILCVELFFVIVLAAGLMMSEPEGQGNVRAPSVSPPGTPPPSKNK